MESKTMPTSIVANERDLDKITILCPDVEIFGLDEELLINDSK
jgi:hypothetical protein